MSFIIGLVIGWLVGTVMTCIILAKRNLEKMEKMSDKVQEGFQDSINVAKATYDYYNKSPEERHVKESQISGKE